MLTHRVVRKLLLEYRALWYAALDAGGVCLVCVLASIAPYLDWGACVGMSAGAAVVIAIQLVVCVVACPMTKPLDWYVSIVALALTTAACVLRIVHGSAGAREERARREELLVAAASLDLLLNIVTIGPIALDALELLRRCWLPHRASALTDGTMVPPHALEASLELDERLLEEGVSAADCMLDEIDLNVAGSCDGDVEMLEHMLLERDDSDVDAAALPVLAPTGTVLTALSKAARQAFATELQAAYDSGDVD
jgi:hypothetical protein